MLINEKTAISTSSILLVPYTAAHVPTYHEWMKDSEIQVLTASEPLSLDSEFDMQKSWRTDADKLTFIACLPITSSSPQDVVLNSNDHDSPQRMLGDVNLFLTAPETEELDKARICTGEIELMIAVSSHRRKGYGRAAVLAFMSYISQHVEEILDEFSGSEAGGSKWKGIQLRVKIGGENAKSLSLFESLGFVRIGEGVNYFGECELWFDGVLGAEGEAVESVRKLGEKFQMERYEELRYNEDER